MALVRKVSLLIALLALMGCGGGSSSIENAASVRFFDAFRGTGNVRLTIGGRLYEAGGEGPSFEYGDGFEYGDAPSGTGVEITVRPYTDSSTTSATLPTQTLAAGAHYTLVGVTTGTTTSGTTTTNSQALRLFRDSIAQVADTEYLRVIHATSTNTPIYLRLVRKSDNAVAYQSFTTSNGGTGLAVGNSTGYLAITPAITSDSEDYTLRVYDAPDFANELESATVTLKVGNPVTAIVYNRSSSSTDLRIKSGTDSVD